MNVDGMASRGFLFVLLALATGVMGCPQAEEAIRQAVKPPEIRVEQILPTGISAQQLDLELGISIDNPNPLGLSLSGIDYNLEFAERPLASGTGGSGLRLVPSGTSEATVPVSLLFTDLGAIYEQFRGADEVPYRLHGKVRVDTPIGEIPIPYDVQGKLPIIRAPRIKALKADVERVSFSGADVVLIIKLENPNSFDLDIRGVDYAMDLEGKPFTSGRVEDARVAPKSTGSIEVPVSLDFGSLGSWAYSVVKGGSADYSLSYKGVYRIMGRDVKHDEEKQGSVKFSR